MTRRVSAKSSVSNYTMSIISQKGYTALMRAAKLGKMDIVSLLVKAGAALDLQNKVYKLIPSLSNAMCDSDLTCVAIAGQIVS